MSGNINIRDTSNFEPIISYLGDCNTNVESLKTKLQNIKNGLPSELLKDYQSLSTPIFESIQKVSNDITNATNRINKSLTIYATVEDDLSSKLSGVYDSIFNDEDYEEELMYYVNKEDEKISYEEFLELVNSSEEYFNKQREQLYNEFLVKLLTATPTIIKNNGTTAYNDTVEMVYLIISDEKIGSNEYQEGLKNFKNKFATKVLNGYDNLDFVPECYLRDQDDYNKALLALSFDSDDFYQKQDRILTVFHEIDDRTLNIDDKIETTYQRNLDTFYELKDMLLDCDEKDPKKILEYYQSEMSNIFALASGMKDSNNGFFISDNTYNGSVDEWYKAIENTKAFEMIKDYVDIDNKNYIFELTNNLDFLSAVYQYDGMNGLVNLYNNYIGGCTGTDSINKNYILNGDIDTIIRYSSFNRSINSLYYVTQNTTEKLKIVNDNEKTALLLFAKDLDVSDVTDEDIEKAKGSINFISTYLLGCKDYEKYIDEWQIKAYAKIASRDKEIASRLLNFTDGADRGIFNNEIMEGYAYDVAKTRVDEMTDENLVMSILKDLVFTNVYGIGYGLTGFTEGIGHAFSADGSKSQRQMEHEYILSLLAGDYSLYAKYSNGDSEVVDMLSTDYTMDYIYSLKLKDATNKDLDELYKMCVDNKIPRYEIEYFSGNINYEEYASYKLLSNTDEETLKLFAKLGNSSTSKWFSEKVFKLTNSVGNMLIPTVLNIGALATGPAGLGIKGLSGTLSALSYGSMFLSTYGKTKNSLIGSGEKDNTFILVNSLLHATVETTTEYLLGRVLRTSGSGLTRKNAIIDQLGIGKFAHAADTFNNYLISQGCNRKLAKYLSNALGEIIEENTENLLIWGSDAITYGAFKGELKLPSIDEIVNTTWETTWMTALTTPILNGMQELALCNVPHNLRIAGKDVQISLSELLLFTNESTNEIDYYGLIDYLNETKNYGIPKVLISPASLGLKDSEVINADDAMVINNEGKVVSMQEGVEIVTNYDYLVSRMTEEEIMEALESPIIQGQRTQFINALRKSDKGIKCLLEADLIEGLPDVTYDLGVGKKGIISSKELLLYALDNDITFDTDLSDEAINGLTKGEVLSLLNMVGKDVSGNKFLKGAQETFRAAAIITEYSQADAETQKLYRWTVESLPSLLKKRGAFITDQKIQDALYTVMFIPKKDWLEHCQDADYTIEEAKSLLGFHEYGTNLNHVRILKDSNNTLLTTIHEIIHGCGGLKQSSPNQSNLGLNESMTEYISHDLADDSQLTMDSSLGYAPGVRALRDIINADIPGLTKLDFYRAYFVTHDVSSIRTAVDEIMGDGYFDKTLTPTFNTLDLPNTKWDKTGMAKIASDIILTYQSKQQ